MNKIKFVVIASTVLASLASYADQKADMDKVFKMSQRFISGSDVSRKVSTFDNTKGENPCASEDIIYVVDIKVRKSQRTEKGQVRKFEDFNTFSISKTDLDAGKNLSDGLCEE